MGSRAAQRINNVHPDLDLPTIDEAE
jgi:hypothetical protein